MPSPLAIEPLAGLLTESVYELMANVAVTAIVAAYALVFHLLMLREGHNYSALTSVYWTLETMTTLGYGDIVFTSDLGRAFSIVVLVTGVVSKEEKAYLSALLFRNAS